MTQYEIIAMIGSRGAQASWDAFLMIEFAMTGARAAWSAPRGTVLATMITEITAHTFHRSTEHASPIAGIAHRSALIIPLAGGLCMRTSKTGHRSVMIDHHLNVLEQLTAMKRARRALTAMKRARRAPTTMNQARRAGPLSLRASTWKMCSTKVNQRSNQLRVRVVATERVRKGSPRKR
jgi:hypothetical protein